MPSNLTRKQFKEKLIKESYSLFKSLSLLKYLEKTYKFASGTDWESEVFIEFKIKKDSFGITKDDVLTANYVLHYIIQDIKFDDLEIDEEESIDYDLTFYVKYKGGVEFEKIIQDGKIDFTF
mgnify:CR=1 FL=1